MGRMHSRGKGISASALPYKRTPPSWLKISSQDVEDNICKFAKKGLTPSQIGVILRDSHGIAQVKSVTGSKILRILKAHGLAPEIPEDLYHLIKKAVAIRKHLERNRKDKDSKFRLILVESRIHRLARYYKKTKKLPPHPYVGDSFSRKPLNALSQPLPALSWHSVGISMDAIDRLNKDGHELGYGGCIAACDSEIALA
ncbi:40S ribosomal protein S13-2 [Citrus sinensis]|uniref:40S ribosomal protein S13-2 n=1 Tax=Citrus sinensis TaxID=2711 RepID=A0ACB8MSF2_CITSI|nr:40S ribosomal protein S13-2 [Citrus sinensis]KAH9788330.1 40S ribosomal protein S13-2 [Citrus sinensis]